MARDLKSYQLEFQDWFEARFGKTIAFRPVTFHLGMTSYCPQFMAGVENWSVICLHVASRTTREDGMPKVSYSTREAIMTAAECYPWIPQFIAWKDGESWFLARYDLGERDWVAVEWDELRGGTHENICVTDNPRYADRL